MTWLIGLACGVAIVYGGAANEAWIVGVAALVGLVTMVLAVADADTNPPVEHSTYLPLDD